MSISDKEKNRRSSKKMYEHVDSMLLDMLEDEDFSKEIFKEWAKNDPKGFFTIMKDRLPKVQPIDQDLQKTLISLKSMMEGLPEVEDVAKALKKEKERANILQTELDQANSMLKAYSQKLKASKAK